MKTGKSLKTSLITRTHHFLSWCHGNYLIIFHRFSHVFPWATDSFLWVFPCFSHKKHRGRCRVSCPRAAAGSPPLRRHAWRWAAMAPRWTRRSVWSTGERRWRCWGQHRCLGVKVGKFLGFSGKIRGTYRNVLEFWEIIRGLYWDYDSMGL